MEFNCSIIKHQEAIAFSVQGTETETRLCPFTVGGMGSIPGQGTKILHATQLVKKKKKKARF